MTKQKKAEAMTNLYVGNLSKDTTERQLKSVFGTFGMVERVTIVLDRETGASQGFAFVEMANSFEARSARKILNGSLVNGHPMQISEARALAVVIGKT